MSWYAEATILRLGPLMGLLGLSKEQCARETFWKEQRLGQTIFEAVKRSFLRHRDFEACRERRIEKNEAEQDRISELMKPIKQEIQKLEEEIKTITWSWGKLNWVEVWQKRASVEEKLAELKKQYYDLRGDSLGFPSRLALYFPSPYLHLDEEEYDPQQDCVHFEMPSQWQCPMCKTPLEYPERALYPCPQCRLWGSWFFENCLDRVGIYAHNPALVLIYHSWRNLFRNFNFWLAPKEGWSQEYSDQLYAGLLRFEPKAPEFYDKKKDLEAVAK